MHQPAKTLHGVTNCNIGVSVWPATAGQETKVPLKAWSVGRQAKMDARNLRARIQVYATHVWPSFQPVFMQAWGKRKWVNTKSEPQAARIELGSRKWSNMTHKQAGLVSKVQYIHEGFINITFNTIVNLGYAYWSIGQMALKQEMHENDTAKECPASSNRDVFIFLPLQHPA